MNHQLCINASHGHHCAPTVAAAAQCCGHHCTAYLTFILSPQHFTHTPPYLVYVFITNLAISNL